MSALALTQRKQTWASLSLDTKLPPIIEGGSSPDLSPKSSKSSKLRNGENPFRRDSRRSSVSSVSSTHSDSAVSSQSTSFMTKSLGESINRRKMSSIDMSKSEKILKKLDLKRRHSVLNVMPDGRRASFRTIGARVTTLLKAKNAFAMLRKRREKPKEEETEDEKDFEIDELPPQPRFASTLSPEAQYAMMKGYEDVVYSNLCRQFPEYRPMLRRNRTPVAGITVKSVQEKYSKLFETKEEARKMAENSDCPIKDMVDGNVESRYISEPIRASTPESEDVPAKSPREKTPTNQSMPAIQNASPIPEKGSKRRHHHCTKNQPEVQNKEKQLVMTYRYQRAMDILDILREPQGVHALSPRKKENRHIEPLKDYNSWSYVWTHEFESKTSLK